ncbi:hypothetical protein [Thiohalophilus sp.]|uniref:hypothetical protein n=1 Tax=Thiohalophilus sp. TaxID=3028392 RepID=UPI002ACE4C2C|nr:hypothetical protein [Thiohalophilus sp.]MDZ7661906.1 hypothetical protein [Thiohalophilus sp.]MDZ7803773.1 hypothetical protein [Thiohalophilus sp.]
MYRRLDDVPVFEYRDGELPAIYYNDVQVALKRLGEDLRFAIPRLKHLDLILQKDAWIIVDRVLNDVPVVAWTDFQTAHRSSLHEPIPCRIRLYHMHGPLVMSRTLEAMELILGEMLADHAPPDDASIAPIKK